ncbi:hypothetical protein B0H14DRAFT_2846891 [Mycena olivaceomarginata]|nr:hypothetical protein B0H14DRAFT_2846891 [Mycena olivaceomarginata]
MASPPPSSPLFRLSGSSSCSSTLIMTPAPGPLPMLVHRGPAPKGHLQPHVSNLPRRRRAPPVPVSTTLRISAPPAPSTSRSRSSPSPAAGNSTSTSYAPSPIQLPSLPFPISASGGPQLREYDSYEREYEHEYLMMKQAQHQGTGPAHANVPRRAKVLTAAQVRARRRRERGMQELGRASGVFVAFESASAEDINEDREEFGAVVRIQTSSAGGETSCEEETGKVLRLVVARDARDDGDTLCAACAFVGKHREGGSRVLVTTPRERAVDALSVGVCCATTISPDPEQVNSNRDTDMDAEEDVHQLLVRWHDLPADDRDEDDEDGDHGGGLRDEWRGLLSRDGIEYLAAALFPAPPSPSPSNSTPPSPSPSSSSPFSSPSPFSFPSPSSSSSSSSPPSSPPPASPSVLHNPPRPIDTADA